MGRKNEDKELIESLYALSNKNPKLVKHSEHVAPADPTITVTSWKMNEFKYYDVPSPFPTLARGLFTRKLDGEHVIVARGYDKFYNIGEVPWNTWEALEANTGPPYTLTLKSNGCIIFIAALTPTKVMITSKHSLGTRGGVEQSHAEVGERWLRRNLEAKGKTEEELAALLWEKNWTVISELCDDSFEEHVLRITPENTGLHLHGINENSKRFKTMLPDVVDAFARDWGFIVTKATVLDTIPAVREFTDRINAAKEWDGEALEGFVVRTHTVDPPGRTAVRTPYPAGSTFFFKVKFDDPYMMYRDWREVTKMLLSNKNGADVAKLPKSKQRYPLTKVYTRWVVGEIKRDRSQFAEYMKNRGIIATRERFLAWLAHQDAKTQQGELGSIVDVDTPAVEKKFGKTIILPVAIPGCGKTAVAVALTHLFGFGHTQSDDVHVKKAGPAFVKNVVKLLEKHNVVIADKNNHLRQHREALRDATAKFSPPVRLMALNWAITQPLTTVHRICGARIVARGENHQTLRADASPRRAHEDVLWMFLENAEELTDAEVDVCVDMEITDTPEQGLRRAVDACVRVLDLPRPTDEKITEALAAAQGYAPKVKKADAPQKKDKPRAAPRYFGILAEIDLEDVLGTQADLTDPAKDWLRRLIQKRRVAKRPHVTITHEKTRGEDPAVWERCMQINAGGDPPLLTFRLGHLVWNDRVMAATVDDLAAAPEEEGGEADAAAADFVRLLPEEIRDKLHVTVGTKEESIPPYEARALVDEWRRKGDKEDIESCPLDGVVVHGRLKGMYT